MGVKTPGYTPNLSKQHIDNFADIVVMRKLTHELVEELLFKRHDLFLEAEAVVKLQPLPEVEELMLWGVLND